VAKPTLGRGLGDLLGSNRTDADPSAPMKPPCVGLRILIDGAQPQTESAAPPAAAPAPQNPAPSVTVVSARETDGELLTRLLAVLGLIGADVALLGWTAHFVFSHQEGLTALSLTACVVSGLVATLCGCAAARLAAGRER
jgi:hypothetical protein